MNKPIYLDYNATTPIDQSVAEVMKQFIDQHFGNPSSSHYYGAVAKSAIQKARNQAAEMLHCFPDEIIFTSGGSESNNLAVKGAAMMNRHKGNHIITTSIEHPAVIEVCRYLEANNFRVTYLPVNEYGMVDTANVEEAITPQTILISVMHANNEVGTIQPIREIAEIANHYGILFHSDCAQSAGKIPVLVDELKVDLLSLAGHKFYAPKGIGILFVKRGVKLEKQIHGADHEMNLRAGTENTASIAAIGMACELISDSLISFTKHLQMMRDKLEGELKKSFSWIKINGHPVHRLPNTSSISFKNIEANVILSALDSVAASAGAACHSDNVTVSSVLQAMKLPLEYAMGTIRLSTGRNTTSDEINSAVNEIKKVINSFSAQGDDKIRIETSHVRLTKFTQGLGCACKLKPQLLEEVVKKISGFTNQNVLVGAETFDDAAVYLIDENTAIVSTVDFFTPIVDDPFSFGAIAAVNSLSDIYAMGAKPLFALNIAGFPSMRLPINVFEEILRGAQKIASDIYMPIVGGHTIDDNEPKFGLAVTGIVHPQKIIRNNAVQQKDVLILTKPLGTGILSTALKQGLLNNEDQEKLIATMIKLNKDASEVMQEIGVSACTDITGFGLLGHMLEMLSGVQASAKLEMDKIPLLERTLELTAANVIPGGTRANYEFTLAHISYGNSISKIQKLILNDAQTSGGLLISVPKNKSDSMLKSLNKRNVEAKIVGEIILEAKSKIIVE